MFLGDIESRQPRSGDRHAAPPAGFRRQRCTPGLVDERIPNAALAERVLASLPLRDREILIRYYLNLQPAEALEQEFGISREEFRNIRANARGLFRALRAQLACLTDHTRASRSISA